MTTIAAATTHNGVQSARCGRATGDRRARSSRGSATAVDGEDMLSIVIDPVSRPHVTADPNRVTSEHGTGTRTARPTDRRAGGAKRQLSVVYRWLSVNVETTLDRLLVLAGAGLDAPDQLVVLALGDVDIVVGHVAPGLL